MLSTNEDRQDRAMGAMEDYADRLGVEIEDEGLDTVVSDFLTDLMHLCDAEDIEWGDMLRRARDHYTEEVRAAS